MKLFKALIIALTVFAVAGLLVIFMIAAPTIGPLTWGLLAFAATVLTVYASLE